MIDRIDAPPGESYDAEGRREEQMFLNDILLNAISSAQARLKRPGEKTPDEAGQQAVLNLQDGITAREAKGETVAYIKRALGRAQETNWSDPRSLTSLTNFLQGLFPTS